MRKVVVVGGSGMLGSALVSVLSRNPSLDVYATFTRPWSSRPRVAVKRWFMFRAGQSFPPAVQLGTGDWIVNAAGLIRHRMGPSPTMMSRSEAIRVNSLLPHELAQIALQTGARMINVTTDCVFSGRAGGYVETSQHDPADFYGQTKSLGEPRGSGQVTNLRCSIVGPEARGKLSLLEWFLAQPEGSVIKGYADHAWNGVTTLALSKVIEGLILYSGEGALTELHHLIPADDVSKLSLLELFRDAFGRKIGIEYVAAGKVDRTLGTSQPEVNNRLWALAGYEKPPRMESMVAELARWVESSYPFAQEVSQ